MDYSAMKKEQIYYYLISCKIFIFSTIISMKGLLFSRLRSRIESV